MEKYMNINITNKLLTKIIICMILILFSSSCCIKLCSLKEIAKKDVELIPRDVLFGNPQKFKARISPDSKKRGCRLENIMSK